MAKLSTKNGKIEDASHANDRMNRKRNGKLNRKPNRKPNQGLGSAK